jgi:hypothetical protein
MAFWNISLELANEFYAWGWRASMIGALITFFGVAFLFWGTRVRDGDFEKSIADLHVSAGRFEKAAADSRERAGKLEISAENLREANIELQRSLERERVERVKMEQRFGARHFTPEQKAAVILAFKGHPMTVHVRGIAEGEALLAANNFAAVLREAGLTVPAVLDVGLTIPPSLGVEVYDPSGPTGLFARAMMQNIPEAKFRTVPFSIGGENADPAIPTMVVRYRTVQ